jgi:3-hydroxyisobutyrate dehydrogenase-like beta-hydroxyacid dehydrogenase
MKKDNQIGKPRLGFIGLGGMGSRMAGRLLSAGYGLTVYNRSRERTRPLESAGAKVADSPRGLAAASDVVLSCVADDKALEEVMLSVDGALAAARPGCAFIDMSTVSPRTSRLLHEEALGTGSQFLDAPVSGSTAQVEQGQLVIFVGGDERTYLECRPILAALGRHSFYLGPSGSGALMKLCVNTLLGLGVQALAEALTLGLRGGLRRERFLEALGETYALSPSQRSKLRNAREQAYAPDFPLRLMYKDYRLIARTAMDLAVPLPVTAAAQQVCAAEHIRQSAAHRDEDFSSVIRAMERMAGVEEGSPGG